MIEPKKKFVPSNYKWSKENCQIEALKYTHRIDFKKNSKGAYPASRLNGWLDEICSHMDSLGNKYKRLIYRFIFPNNYCYVGLTHNFEKRKESHMKNLNSSVYRHMIKTNLIPIHEKLTDYLDIDEAKKQEEFWKLESEKQGYTILNKSKTGALGGNLFKWSKDMCLNEALKYEYRTEFRKYSKKAYQSAFNNGWLDEICVNLKYKYEYWDKEKCREEALKFNNRHEYNAGSCSSWDKARRNGWLDEICSHMKELKKPSGYWTIDECKKEASKYTSKNELRKNNSYVHDKLRNNKLLDLVYKK